jgi:uridine kinase
METGTRGQLLERLALAAESVRCPHPARIAIDGPDAAGKTTLADELAVILRARGREVIRASVDGFHLPRAQRYRRGQYSAEGCYHDTFDYDGLRQALLDPLGPHGDLRFRPAIFDHRTDTALSLPTATASEDAVLLFDGVFLLRPEVIDQWQLRIFVSVAFEEALDRARTRDRAFLGSVAEIERRYRERYIPAQELYFAEACPEQRADIVVYNDEPQCPEWDIRRR